MALTKKQVIIDFYKEEDFNNDYLFNLILEFIELPRIKLKYTTEQFKNLFYSFADKFEDIKSEKDFTEKLFWKQIKHFKSIRPYNNENPTIILILFYRFILNKYPDYPFFLNSQHLTKDIFFYDGFKIAIKDDYFIVKYNQYDRILNKDKVYFILENLDSLTTRNRKEDYIGINVENLQHEFYKKALFAWLYDTSKIIKKNKAYINLISIINMLLNLKQQKKYNNPSIKHFSNQEAVLIKQYLLKYGQSFLQSYISVVRSFFKWAVDSDLITVESMFFDYLTSCYTPHTYTAKAIPENDFSLLDKELLEESKKSVVDLITYTIFHLLVQTEFRINQILHLTIDCIHPSVKPGQYIIKSNSKTSHGEKNDFIISEVTYKTLMNCIEKTNDLRDNTNIETLKNYIFVYQYKDCPLALFTNTRFNNELRKACKKCNVPVYTASNLRDTHMTRAYEHVLKTGKSDIEMSLLSKHRHIDTTKSHYIEIELEKMLESTYGITIGQDLLNTDKKIVDNIPDNLNNKEHDVEFSCGKCSADTCMITSALPCLACKYFITTPNHIQYFEKAIAMLDKNILTAKTEHDKEDLVKMKTFYALYLKAIYNYMESDTND